MEYTISLDNLKRTLKKEEDKLKELLLENFRYLNKCFI